ncbi:MAG: ATP synthase F0 subunit B [Oligoflexia bacterium]|nr:ATP synthase F0 subunit B [Oligoflexia bacterium]
MIKNKNKDRIFLLTLLTAMIVVSLAAFAESGSHASGANHGVPKIVYYQALNFFGLLIILYFVVKNKVSGYFSARHKTLTAAITEAQRMRTEAAKMHEEYSVKIQNLEREAGQMLEQMKLEGKEAKQRLLDEAKKLVENIEREAKRTAQNELDRAKAELYDDVLQQALDGARTLLTNTVVDNDQRRLQKEFVEKIEAVQ